jgi:hypothetical protein
VPTACHFPTRAPAGTARAAIHCGCPGQPLGVQERRIATAAVLKTEPPRLLRRCAPLPLRSLLRRWPPWPPPSSRVPASSRGQSTIPTPPLVFTRATTTAGCPALTTVSPEQWLPRLPPWSTADGRRRPLFPRSNLPHRPIATPRPPHAVPDRPRRRPSPDFGRTAAGRRQRTTLQGFNYS